MNTIYRPNTRKTVVSLHPLDRAAQVEQWEREMIDDGPALKPMVKLTVWALLLIGSLSVWIWAGAVLVQWVGR